METRAKQAQDDFKVLETRVKSIEDKSKNTGQRLDVTLRWNEELEKQLSDMEVKLKQKKQKRNAHDVSLVRPFDLFSSHYVPYICPN